MKIRLDHVTNSSSSSFIITLKNHNTYYDFKESISKMIEIHNDLTGKDYLTYDDVFDDSVDNESIEFEIWSAYDNSVPYFISEFIEVYLDAERRFHG